VLQTNPAAVQGETMDYNDVLEFWFNEIDSKQWWHKDPQFDRLIEDRFASLHAMAVRCELFQWRDSAPGRLAEIILLDQFSRNIYRDTPLAFQHDPLALCLAQEAVARGIQKSLTDSQRSFLYMPFMHSESPQVHVVAARLFSEPEVASNLDFELRHKAIIDRFGRYPHRNEILDRISTAEEMEFLQDPGSSF
jgi:uncharacterized protein (DUF924 family)